MLRRYFNFSTCRIVQSSICQLYRHPNISSHAALLRLCCTQQPANAVFTCSVRNLSDLRNQHTDTVTFESACDETLDSLAEYFEELVEGADHLNAADVSFSDGVLTVKFGEPYGTYVINRQTPNSQIWLSSPTSGPKRYDFVNGGWIYRHEKRSLHQLLDDEISRIVKSKANFKDNCKFSNPF